MNTKALIYDFDGVICDSVNVKTQAFAEMYSNYGSEIVENVIKYHIENGGVSRFDKFRFFHKNFLNIILKDHEIIEMSKHFSSLVFEKVINSSYINGAYNFVSINSTKYLQFICTGTPENEIIEILSKKNVLCFFNGIFGSPRKKGEILKWIIDFYCLSPNEAIFFGDAMTDYWAAYENKIPFIGIKSNDTTFPKGTIVIKDFNDNKLINII